MIPWSNISDFTGWTFTGVFVLLFFFGLIVSRRTLRDIIEVWRNRVKDTQEQLTIERARNDALQDALRELLTYSQTADKILQAWYSNYQRSNGDRPRERDR